MIESTNEATVALPTDRAILIIRSWAAPRATVFDAWTRPEHVSQWWDPSRRPLARCEIDLRPGGRFRFEHQGDAGPGHVFAGIYREIDRPARLVFAIPGPTGAGEVLGILEFTESAGRTTLHMTIACQSKADRDALLRMEVHVGTVRTLENLDAYLATTR